MTDNRKNTLLQLGLITLLVLFAYGNILHNGFVWDDFDIIVNNPLLAKLGNIPSFFLTEDKVSAATGYYRPVTYISFALDRAIWGLNPLGFNITNLLLQILVALSFYLVIREIFRQERLALLGAALFALHPLATETVNFHAGGRNTLLCAAFALLSLLFYARGRTAVSVLFFTLAIFSKEFALLLPAVFLFYDLRLRGKRFRFGAYLPYLAPVLLYLTLRSLAVQKANFMGHFRLNQQLWLTPYLAVRYLVNMLFPFRLKVMYDEQTSITICAVCLAVVLLLVAGIFLFRKQKELAFSDFWFLLFLLPVINIVPMMSTTLVADRYAYFSLMGFALALAALLCKANRTVSLGVGFLLGALFIFVDLRQNGVWSSEVSLFTRMTQDAPSMSIGYRNLALCYYRSGDLLRAEPLFEQASAKGDLPIRALAGTASIFLEAKKPEKAEPLLKKAVEVEPANPEPYLLLKLVSEQRGDLPRAQEYLAQANRAIPGLAEERKREAAVFAQEGEKFLAQRNYVNARNILWRALVVDPENAAARAALEAVNRQQGQQGVALQ